MYFTYERINRIINELDLYVHRGSVKIPEYRYKKCDAKIEDIINVDTSTWEVFKCDNNHWGEADKYYWFIIDIKIPDKMDGKIVTYTLTTGKENDGWDAANPQFLIFVNGKLIQGMDMNHREIILTEKAKSGDIYTIALNAYSGLQKSFIALKSKISILEKEVEELYYNIKVPLEIAKLLDKEDKRRIDILNYLNQAINMLSLIKPYSLKFYESVNRANGFLKQDFYEKYCGHENAVATCVGHTHIDVAWLWTLAQTRQKVARSFSTVLNLMEQYPEYIFMSSQPQLYKFLKEDYPEIYNKVKEKIKEGKWEPEGAMWLEADCNISSGESLVRQILFGTRFFKKEFNVESKLLWLPDVFGYSAALPQILKKSGIDYFMTTKISWNEYNKLPWDTFMWRGLDGTEVLTHFITTKDANFNLNPHVTTYNGNLIPSQIIGGWDRYQQKDLNNDVLIAFGFGDGGGGPTKEMLENGKRMAKGIPGCPKVKMGKALDFFKRLENRVSNNKKLPKWVGELYFEYHRGTYTSMARNKKFNRLSEFLYQDLELLSTINSYVGGHNNYPQSDINKAWEIILLNQFHDILPGSSIKPVYEDSKKQYLKIINSGKKLVDSTINAITSDINIPQKSVAVFNQLSFDRSDIVQVDIDDDLVNTVVYDDNGQILLSQMVMDNKGNRKIIFFASDVPAKGYKVFKLGTASTEYKTTIIAQNNKLSNKYFDIEFDSNCNITSIYDKTNNRQILKPNKRANVIQAFEDKPHNFDAWDINIYYQEKMWEINDVQSIKVTEKGPIRACIEVKRKFYDSTIIQNIYIYNDIPRIDFKTIIDWKEKQVLLKAAFPVDVHADKATYEIQYGNVERPTHWNTSWDYARFEVCAHKWADLSEDNYGVSLLNNCKYGHDIKDSVMRLTLLKSAVHPNEDADREVHEFTYSIYPHTGNWKDAATVNMAYALNCPMRSRIENAHKGKLPERFSLINIDKENVFIEVVKKAEDSDDIIIRLYECYNRRSNVKLTFFKELKKVSECNLLEDNIKDIDVKTSNSFEFEIKPYEIKTFKLKIN